jgi:hypothetical protein
VCRFLATNEDMPTRDVVLLVDAALFFAGVINCESLSLLHEVPVLILVLVICLRMFAPMTLLTKFYMFVP